MFSCVRCRNECPIVMDLPLFYLSSLQWQRPQRNDSVLELVERGVNSEQKKIQAEREEKVLAQLFLSKSR